MAGMISWTNEAFADGVVFTDNGNAFSGSDVDNLGDARLAIRYQAVTTSVDILDVTLATSTAVRCIGLAGITTESGAPIDVDLIIEGFAGGISQFVVSGLSNDVDGGSVFEVLDTEAIIDAVEVRLASTSSSEGWIGIGAVWIGHGLALGEGEDAYLLADWSPSPVDTDVKSISRGGQVYGRRGRRARLWTLPIGFARGIDKLARSGRVLGAISAAVGSVDPIVVALRSGGQAVLSIYGTVEDSARITRLPGDRFGQVFSVEESS